MGMVYAAHDPMLARTVALKVLHEKRASALVEARALARLAHPNIVSIYDVGETDGRLFLAMERVTGTTLGAWLGREIRPWRAIVDVFLDAGRALAAAHSAGVVHGDFKPDNVIVRDDGRVCVTDFGLARLLSDEVPAMVAGTPAYMAPEQLDGGVATPSSDQFAFATALHEALYGARPFAAPTTSELRAQMHASRLLTRPTTRDAPDWLFPIVARGVEVDPRFRHRSMGELCKRISRKLAGDVQLVINAVLQLGMFLFHAGISALFIWAMASANSPATTTHPASEARVRLVATVIVVWLAALFFLGWGPLGVVWTPINAWGLLRRRRWAVTSTLVYAACSTLTCIGTPVAIYALVTLWPLRKKAATSPESMRRLG